MIKQLISLVLAVFLLLSFSLSGQNNYPVKTINGTDYYIYTVQASEGLYAISRKFEVSQGDINNANPDIHSGLKVGQQILIPVKKKNTEQVITPKKVLNQQFIQHEVKKRQTLFAISRLYNVSQDEIRKYNPQIDKTLRTGDILLIPKQDSIPQRKESVQNRVAEQSISKPVLTEHKPSYISHEVQPKETLYSISRKYQVEVAEIVNQNPGVDKKLTIGTVLRIPTATEPAKIQAQKKGIETATSRTPVDLNKVFGKAEASNIQTPERTIRIAYLLPFMLDQGKNDSGSDRFIDFYAGSVLAISEAKQKGISLEIFTFDTEKSEERIAEILSRPELKTVDLLIGPAFSNQVQLVADFAKEFKVKTLIPFTSKIADIDTNPYLFQFNPGADAELKFSTELLTSGSLKNANVIFAELPGISSFDEGKIWADKLQSELKNQRKQYAKIQLSSPDYADFGVVLKKNEKNLIIFNTDKFAFINPFLPALKSRDAEYNIILFEQYAWRNQNDKLTGGIFISPFMSDLNGQSIAKFQLQFERIFQRKTPTESPRYDLLGYDLSTYFISLINLYGSDFTNDVSSNNNVKGLQSKPNFKSDSSRSGFINQQLYLGKTE